MHTIALMSMCLTSIITMSILHLHTQHSPTLLVGLKLANIIQHQHGFPGRL